MGGALRLFAFLGLLFPNGRLPTSRWRPFAWLVVAAVVAGSVATALSPGPIDTLAPIRNPLGIEGAPNLSTSVEVVIFALTLGAAASLLVRLRRAEGVERQQIKWFAYAATFLAVGAILSWVISDAVGVWWLHWEVGFVATMVGLVGLPVALGIAILRYRLHDTDLIINRTLVYGLLTAVMAGIFEVNVVALQELLLVLVHVEDSQLAYFASAMVWQPSSTPSSAASTPSWSTVSSGRTSRPGSDPPISEYIISTILGVSPVRVRRARRSQPSDRGNELPENRGEPGLLFTDAEVPGRGAQGR